VAEDSHQRGKLELGSAFAQMEDLIQSTAFGKERETGITKISDTEVPDF